MYTINGKGVSLGIPSSATTDSNNSNETSGSPSSITSGGSPVQSPLPVQQQLQQQASNTSGSGSATQQQQINLNYSSDSTAADGTAKDKHNKNESNANSKTKVNIKKFIKYIFKKKVFNEKHFFWKIFLLGNKNLIFQELFWISFEEFTCLNNIM